MTDHYCDDDDEDDWHTVSVTPLTSGVIATVRYSRETTDTWQWPAMALLNQTRRGRRDRIVLGVLTDSGEVEACYSGCGDDDRLFGIKLVHLDHGPYMNAVVPHTDSAERQTPANACVRKAAVAQPDSRP